MASQTDVTGNGWKQFHIHGLHWDCSCAEAWYGACTEGCGPYQTLTPAAAAVVVVVVVL